MHIYMAIRQILTEPNKLLREKSLVVEKVDKEIKALVSLLDDNDHEILKHVESLRIELKSLDDRLTNKEVRDRSEYGHVQYKLSSLQNEMLDEKKVKKKNPFREKDFL